MDGAAYRVTVTGPEGSGTRWLADIVRSHLGVPAEHRPMPEHDVWWEWRSDPEGTRYIVIVRRPDVTQLSILGQHARWEGEPVRALREDWPQARDWWQKAIRRLAEIPGAWWVSYEALVAAQATQVASLAAWLGVEPVGPLPPARDENAKWLSFLER